MNAYTNAAGMRNIIIILKIQEKKLKVNED